MAKKTQKFGKYLTDNPAYTWVPIKQIKKEHGRDVSHIRAILNNAKREAYKNYRYWLNEM